ncbi:MAG: pdaA [Paenibacillus sp.]|nr:pdaA [Paenibacillus sp.]
MMVLKMNPLVLVALGLMLLTGATVATAEAAADRTYHFGFKKSKNGSPASIDEEGFKPLLEKHGALYRADSSEKNLYVTFDNGYENGNMPKILDTLKEKRVPAAFFVTGQFIREQPELLKRIAAEGHIIGNHTWSHPDMTQISDEKIAQELTRVKEQTLQLTGQKQMIYVRPPQGIFNERTLAVSQKLGYTNVFWSIAYVDWDVNRQKGWKYAYDQVVGQLHPGAVLLLHSISKDNADALGAIIDAARQQGYSFQSLDRMMELPPM